MTASKKKLRKQIDPEEIFKMTLERVIREAWVRAKEMGWTHGLFFANVFQIMTILNKREEICQLLGCDPESELLENKRRSLGPANMKGRYRAPGKEKKCPPAKVEA